jgi:hypothetical protein
MPEYRVEWSVEVEADDPEAAARLALAIQQSANRAMSGVFCVWGKDDPDHPTLVDLFPERRTPSRTLGEPVALARLPET